MLHPFMPYVTEEIYGMLPIKEAESIMISSYPEYDKKLIFKAEKEIMDDSIEFIKSFRNIKAENNITKEMKVIYEGNDLVKKMLKLDEYIIDKPLDIKSYNVFSKNIKATIYFEKTETDEDKALRENQIKTLQDSIARREKLLSNENYVNKAPANIVEMDRQKLEEEKNKLAELLK
jgi:valyl-tRNA synthetase